MTRLVAMAILFLLVLSPGLAPLRAELPFDGDPFLHTFYRLYELVARADEESYRSVQHRKDREALLERAIEMLRGPDPSQPSGFRYLRARDKGVYVDVAQAVVKTLYTAPALHTLSGSSEETDEVNFYCPGNRSIGRGNRDVFIKAYTIDWDGRGGRQSLSRNIDTWIKRGRNLSVPLGEGRRNVQVRVWVGAKQGHIGQALLRVQVAKPVFEDDPQNPNFELLRDLLAAQDAVSLSMRRDELLRQLDLVHERLRVAHAARAAEPSGPTFEILRRLQFVNYLLDGTVPDQRRGRDELRGLIEELRSGRISMNPPAAAYPQSYPPNYPPSYPPNYPPNYPPTHPRSYPSKDPAPRRSEAPYPYRYGASYSTSASLVATSSSVDLAPPPPPMGEAPLAVSPGWSPISYYGTPKALQGESESTGTPAR